MFVYPVEIAFSKSCPRIVVEVKEADSSRTAESATITKSPDPMETRQLTEKEKEQLRTGMSTYMPYFIDQVYLLSIILLFKGTI